MLAPSVLKAQAVRLSGSAPEYRGSEISLYTQEDLITGERKIAGRIRFDDQGAFNTTLNLSGTTAIFADFGIYHAFFFAEPGHTYSPEFPPRKEKTEAQKRNPFFEPDHIWLHTGTRDDDLNRRIRQFEAVFQTLENRFFNSIYLSRSRNAFETLQEELNRQISPSGNAFVEAHRKYRLATLEFALYQGHSDAFIEKHFAANQPLPQLPAYTDLFNQLFTNYFSFIGNSIRGDEFMRLVHTGTLEQLRQYLTTGKNWSAPFTRQVILKGLNDAWHSGQFSKNAIEKHLKEIVASNWPASDKAIAERVLRKASHLAPGTMAPDLELVTTDGKRMKLSDLRGQTVYLHFTDPENPICRQHLEALNIIHQNFNQAFTIVTVLVRRNTGQPLSLPGLITTTQANIRSLYDVVTYPTSYLIDKDGKLLYSPAYNPMNDLEVQLRSLPGSR